MQERDTMNFRKYNPSQSSIFGLDIDSKIPEHHLVRYVSAVIDEIDLSDLYCLYSDEGSPAYHPKMMLKIVVYAYITGIYTCRKIARAVRENIAFIWLAAEQEPDFRTISHFAWQKCPDVLQRVFTQVLTSAHEKGYVSFDTSYVDGTTLHARAGKNTYIWKKNVERYHAQAAQRVQTILQEAEQLNLDEQLEYGVNDLPEVGEHLGAGFSFTEEVNSDALQKKLAQKDAMLKSLVSLLKKNETANRASLKKLKSAINKIAKANKTEIPKLQKYESQRQIIGDYRNSTSKTEHDATFIRLKNGLLAPGYVTTISTSDQFVTGMHLYNSPTETKQFPQLMMSMYEETGVYPKEVVGDAAYGTALNLDFANKYNIESYLKTQDYRRDYWDSSMDQYTYDEQLDVWICPNNKHLELVEEKAETNNGPERIVKKYACNQCADCPFADKCISYKDKSSKSFWYDPYISPLKAITVSNIRSKKGKEKLRKRGIEPEAVFAFMKWNRKFDRFTVRSLRKCRAQLTLILLGHNIGKMYKASGIMAQYA